VRKGQAVDMSEWEHKDGKWEQKSGKDFEGDFGDIDWDALKSIEADSSLEQNVHPDKSPEDLAEKILTDAAPSAAMAVVKIALGDPNSNTRLRASQYILDRAIGRVGDGPTKNAPWDDVYDKASIPMEADK
jgi:hypothetical protein